MDEEVKLVTFKLRGEEYSFEIDCVQEVRRMRKVVRVPEVPDFVEGIIKLRGKVIPVVNLRKRLGLEAKGHEKSTRIIIVKVEDHTLGLIVDSVEEVSSIPREEIDPPDSVLTNVDFLKGVGKDPGRMSLIVDIKKLLGLEVKELLDSTHLQGKGTS